MDLPDRLRQRYELRAPTRDDLEPVAAVLSAEDLDDADEVVLDTGFLKGQWERHGFDLTTDAWVVTDPAEVVVGYGQVTRDETDVAASWGVVHPEHRGLGVGTALFGRIEARAIQLVAGVPGARFRHAVNAGEEAAAAMLRRHGLQLVRHFWHMALQLPPGFDAGPVPPGIAVTPLGSRDDLREVHAVLDEAFADHWDHHHEPFEDWVDDRAQGPDYDPTLRRLAWEGERLIGALTGVALDDSGGRSASRLRRVRHPRDPLCPAGSRRSEPHGSHAALRERRHKDRQALRPVGAWPGSRYSSSKTTTTFALMSS